MCVSMASLLLFTSENTRLFQYKINENPKEETSTYAQKSQSMLHGGRHSKKTFHSLMLQGK